MPLNVQHTDLLVSSYRKWTGRDLVTGATAEARARNLWTAPFVVVAHGTEAEPIFCYGNAAALARFEMTWDEFTALPSRRSAEPVNQAERAALLARVTAHGYIDDYAGVRIAKSGRRFRIENATVWNVVDAAGVYQGQAATFSQWTDLL